VQDFLAKHEKKALISRGALQYGSSAESVGKNEQNG
jgi:hypothetical protein